MLSLTSGSAYRAAAPLLWFSTKYIAADLFPVSDFDTQVDFSIDSTLNLDSNGNIDDVILAASRKIKYTF